MDFTQPDAPVDGVFRRVLFVRDLASGYVLLAQPCESECAAVARQALERLFAIHGPPLALKSDNGSAFVEEQVARLLCENSVIPLFSPPYWPRYNGSCERGLGWLKVRARHIAALELRPDSWSSCDLQVARATANELSRPWGWDKPTPSQAWADREPISPELRRRFVELRESILADFCAAEVGLNRSRADEVRAPRIIGQETSGSGAGGIKPPPPGPGMDTPEAEKAVDSKKTTRSKKAADSKQAVRSRREIASMERKATAGALVDLGFLCYRKRTITPPIKPGKRANK